MKPTETTALSYKTFNEKMMQHLVEQRAEQQYLMEKSGARIAERRWQRGHRRTRCEKCDARFRDTLLLCMEDCSWNEQHPKRLRHRCSNCIQLRDDDDSRSADSPQPPPRDPAESERA